MPPPPLPFPKDCKACSGAQHMMDMYARQASLLQGKQQRNVQEHPQQQQQQQQQQQSQGTSGEGGSTHKHNHHQQQQQQQQQHQQPEEAGPSGAGSSIYGPYGRQCPPDTQELGRATWTFLHTMAAYYPEAPSRTQQTLMRNVLDGVAEFYPCSFCRAHLQNQVRSCRLSHIIC